MVFNGMYTTVIITKAAFLEIIRFEADENFYCEFKVH